MLEITKTMKKLHNIPIKIDTKNNKLSLKVVL